MSLDAAFPASRGHSKGYLQLGAGALILYGRYHLGLRSGYLRWKTPPYKGHPLAPEAAQTSFLSIPTQETLVSLLGDCARTVVAEADEIAGGRARLFGGEPRPFFQAPSSPLAHWTDYARGKVRTEAEDVKLVWEGGRFGWALTLARAYRLTGEDRHARTFWELAEGFLETNPPYFGPHWESAQEAAFRLISLVFAYQVLRESAETTAAKAAALAQAVAAHAERIPPTLTYARAQNNNHLLAEAAGLLTASSVLPDHPNASTWRELGWRWFNHGLATQIAGDGSYVQHSANYHRLMLQIALWGAAAARAQGLELDWKAHQALAAATCWALGLMDPLSGHLPNLGPNDGGQLLPMASTSWGDFRPTLAAAALAFLGETPFPPGPWDELGLWMGVTWIPKSGDFGVRLPLPEALAVLRNPASGSWGYLRVANFTGRPGHADLLHFDLWRGGLNLAQDAGSYLYNAPPPGDNVLARTAVHNTVTLDGGDQMTRTGRFLWLDWPHSEILERRVGQDGQASFLSARHDGYRSQGAIHQRDVEARPDGSWVVLDRILPAGSTPPGQVHTVRLHWLLQDWPWQFEETGSIYRLRLDSPQGSIWLEVEATVSGQGSAVRVQLARAGEPVAGSGPVDPAQGWASLTYADKQPALSFALVVEGQLAIRFRSEWEFVD